MRIAVMGDNCIDVYPRLGKRYVTGNAVDTGVHLRRLGAAVSIITTVGSDPDGEWTIKTLAHEGLDISHVKMANGATAVTQMDMDGNERIHGDYLEGVGETMTFDQADVDFAAGHELVHAGLWGRVEPVIPNLRQAGAVVSFDYADRLDHPIIEMTLPYVSIGFFSYHRERDSFIENYLRDKVARGLKIAVATMGEQGSLAWDGREFASVDAYPATVVNTVGAGDAYIAGFLFSYLSGGPLAENLDLGSRIGAESVSVFEPWEIKTDTG